MASKSRAKAAAGPGKGKTGRRPPTRVKSGDVPLMPIVVGAILGVLAITMIGLIVYFERPASGPQPVAGVPCDSLEHSQVHYHAALQIIQADRPSIALYNPVTFAAFSTNLTGVEVTYQGLLSVANAR